MKTDDLIAALTRDLRPAMPLPSPVRRLGGWLAACPLFLGAGLLVWGVRDDAPAFLARGVQMQSMVFAVVTAGAAALAALLLAIPAARGVATATMTAFAAVAVWMASLVSQIAVTGASLAEALSWPYSICLVKVATMAAIPAAALWAMLRRAAALSPAWTTGMAALAAAAVGALGTQLACPNASPAHVLLGHVGAMSGLSAFAAVTARFAARGTPRR